MNKVLLGVIAVVAVAVGYFAFGHKAPLDPAAEVLEKVTIAQASEFFLYAPLYVAEEKGFFTEEGLDVVIVTAGGDDKAFAALVSGDAQFAVGDPTFAAIAGEQGRPGKVVAALLNGVPFWGIAKNPDISPITTAADLNGKSVATFPSPSTAYALQKKMFESASLTPNIKEVAFGALILAMEQGEVDIALELEPNVSTAVKAGSHIVYSLSSQYPEFAVTGVTALPDYVNGNKETVQKVVNAIQKADTFIRSNPDEVARVLRAKFPDIPEDVAVAALKNTIAANVIPPTTVTSESAWNAAIQLRKDTGDLKTEGAFADYVDNSFAENAH